MNITLYNNSWQNQLPLLESESIDLIIIDLPYIVTKEKWDKVDQVTPELSLQLLRIAKPNCSLYVWGGVGEKSQTILDWFPIFKKNWYFKDWITWKKQRGMGNRRGWLYTREELLWFVKDNKQFIWNKEFQYSTTKREKSTYGYILPNGRKADDYIKSEYKRFTNVWDDISETTFNTSGTTKLIGKHFTPKPEKAIERIIKLHTKKGDTVLDCFLGSGTTGVVSKRLNRNFIGIEIDKEYIELSQQRIDEVKICSE